MADLVARISLSAHVEFIRSASRVKVLKHSEYVIFHFADMQVQKPARTLTDYSDGIRP